MIGFIIDTEFVWGFQARIIGLSKTSSSFYYPPPTTFLGALAEVIGKNEMIGESAGLNIASELGKNLLAIGVRPLNCIPLKYEDVNRIIAIKITSGVLYPSPSDLAKSFDSPARGKTILSSFNDSPTLRWFVVFGKEKLEIGGREIKINEDIFWKIHRIGSKESIVSVSRVESFNPKTIEGEITTTYSFPIKDLEIIKEETSRNWVYEAYINPFSFGNPVKDYIEGKNILLFKVPIINVPDEEYFCRVKAKKAFHFNDEVVVGWLR